MFARPEPPVDLEQLVADIYAEQLERVALRDDSDLEDEFVAAPLPNNDVVDLS